MKKLKIGIVEDDMIIADTLTSMLQSLEYDVTEQASRYSEAIEMIENEQPDLLLLDINLVGKLDGIDVARIVGEKYGIPYIFLTANSDAHTISRAKEVRPMAYLTKPVTKELLFSAIEIAFSNFNATSIQSAPTPTKDAAPPRDFIFVKDGYQFRKVLFSEIHYLESEHNYVAIHLEKGSKILVRSKFEEFIENLDPSMFMRVHRSYTVNLPLVDNVFPTELSVQGKMVPIGKSYKEEVYKALGIG